MSSADGRGVRQVLKEAVAIASQVSLSEEGQAALDEIPRKYWGELPVEEGLPLVRVAGSALRRERGYGGRLGNEGDAIDYRIAVEALLDAR